MAFKIIALFLSAKCLSDFLSKILLTDVHFSGWCVNMHHKMLWEGNFHHHYNHYRSLLQPIHLQKLACVIPVIIGNSFWSSSHSTIIFAFKKGGFLQTTKWYSIMKKLYNVSTTLCNHFVGQSSSKCGFICMKFKIQLIKINSKMQRVLIITCQNERSISIQYSSKETRNSS